MKEWIKTNYVPIIVGGMMGMGFNQLLTTIESIIIKIALIINH